MTTDDGDIEARYLAAMTPVGFRDWLERQPPGSIVGTLDRLGDNPFDRYIRAATGGGYYMSGASVLSTDRYYQHQRCPNWAYDTQLWLFRNVRRFHGEVPVTCEQALDALASAVPHDFGTHRLRRSWSIVGRWAGRGTRRKRA